MPTCHYRDLQKSLKMSTCHYKDLHKSLDMPTCHYKDLQAVMKDAIGKLINNHSKIIGSIESKQTYNSII